MDAEADDSMDSGRLIASSCRQKIIEALSEVKETHLMDLVRRVNSTYTQVNRNLQILEKEGILRIRSVGRLRMIQLERDNSRTGVILMTLRMLRSADATPPQKSEC